MSERIPKGARAGVELQIDAFDRRTSHRLDENTPLGAPLHRGITLIEASAGTGKTYSITTLVLRLLLEPDENGKDRDIGRILVVTFTNAATDELITRIRRRLREAVDFFADPAPADDSDTTLADLRHAHPDGLPRLQKALSALDRLAVFTIHGFCKRVLEESALESGTPADAQFVEDEKDLVDLVLRDWWRRHVVDDAVLAPLAAAEGWTYTRFRKDAELASRFPDTSIEPAPALDGTADVHVLQQALRVDCIHALRDGLRDEKTRARLLGFSDLLTRLATVLRAESSSGPMATEIRRHYDVALIDEFQDTDPLQAEIFTTAFAGRPLFLIGDPKQAIYGFRGADVRAYVDVARRAERRLPLRTNRRSTRAMIEAVNGLFGACDVPFLEPGIDFTDAEPLDGPDAVQDLLAADAAAAPLTWLFVPPIAGTGKNAGEYKEVDKGKARTAIQAAVAREVVRLLELPGSDGSPRLLEPSSIAILVRSGFEGKDIRDALARVGVRAIVAGMGDVLQSDEAAEMQVVMQAIAAPADASAVRAALATRLWGMTASGIHALEAREDDWAGVLTRLGSARTAWARDGFVRALRQLLDDCGAEERLLSLPDGERRLTNLRHVLELLHGVAHDERLSAEGLLLWLAHARATADRPDDERTELRLESDDDAVRIITMHKSKGLEFDVVFCPSLWESRRTDDGDPVLVHDEQGIVFDHGSDRYAERHRISGAETLAEDLRLAYVALTRAHFRTYVAWGAVKGHAESAIGYLLARAGVAPEASAITRAEAAAAFIERARASLESLIPASGAGIQSVSLDEAPAPRLSRGAERAATPVARTLGDAAGRFTTWQIASFTGLTRGAEAHDPRDTSDDDGQPLSRRPNPDAADIMDFPSGAAPGIALHDLFEHADFAASDDEFRELATDTLAHHRLLPAGAERRVDAIAGMTARVLRNPLPGAAFALRDVPRERTLREWAFDLPLGPVDGHVLEGLFAEHGGAVARRYAPMLGRLGARQAHGFLTGVVDLAFEHDGRWHVVDWKSNHLGREASAYAQDALEEAMAGAHYVLQYHLYVTALHRFLRSRVKGYDFDTHVGDVWYAFLRGIDGTGTGWFHDRPSRALVEALDALCSAGVEAIA